MLSNLSASKFSTISFSIALSNPACTAVVFVLLSALFISYTNVGIIRLKLMLKTSEGPR